MTTFAALFRNWFAQQPPDATEYFLNPRCAVITLVTEKNCWRVYFDRHCNILRVVRRWTDEEQQVFYHPRLLQLDDNVLAFQLTTDHDDKALFRFTPDGTLVRQVVDFYRRMQIQFDSHDSGSHHLCLRLYDKDDALVETEFI